MIRACLRGALCKRTVAAGIALAVAIVSAASADPLAAIKLELEPFGITPTISYEGGVASDVSGGATRGSAYSGVLHLQAEIDGAKAFAAPGVLLFFDVMDTHGGQPSDIVGDAQGVSNIAAPPHFTLYEAWVEFNAPSGRLSALIGRYDLNSEFYRLESAGMFTNSSFGIGPEFGLTGVAGPSIFPDPSIGVRFIFKPLPDLVVRAAVLDGVPPDRAGGPAVVPADSEGALLVGEVELLGRPGKPVAPGQSRSLIGRGSNPPYDDKIAVGGWYYTAAFQDLLETATSPNFHRGSGGAYFLVDSLLYQDAPARISGFLQLGIGDERVNRFGSYAGFGLAGTGLLPFRPSDQAGLAVSIAANGSHYLLEQKQLGMPNHASETVIEAMYLAQVTDWLSVEPHLQYVVHPGTAPHIANALVFQLQFEVSG